MFLALLMAFSSKVSKTKSVLPVRLNAFNISVISLVFGVLKSNLSKTLTLFFAAKIEKAERKANLLTFFGKERFQLFGFGPCEIPPCLQRGFLEEPTLARPVPFCFQGLTPPPETSPLVLVEEVPWRWLALKTLKYCLI